MRRSHIVDDSLYTPGRTLVFECPTCRKQFKIRVGVKAATNNNAEQDFDGEQNEEERLPLGHLVVVENAFHLRQEIPLFWVKTVWDDTSKAQKPTLLSKQWIRVSIKPIVTSR